MEGYGTLWFIRQKKPLKMRGLNICCPTRIRTSTGRTKICSATVTPWDNFAQKRVQRYNLLPTWPNFSAQNVEKQNLHPINQLFVAVSFYAVPVRFRPSITAKLARFDRLCGMPARCPRHQSADSAASPRCGMPCVSSWGWVQRRRCRSAAGSRMATRAHGGW